MLRKIFLFMLIVFLTACSSTKNVPLSVVSTATSIPPTATITPSPVPTETQIPSTATAEVSPAQAPIGWTSPEQNLAKAGSKPDLTANGHYA